MEWGLSRIFGRPIQGSCPVGDRQHATDVILDVPSERTVDAIPENSPEIVTSTDIQRLYRLKEGQELDLRLPHQILEQQQTHRQSLLHAQRQMTGYGQERGGMHIVIINPHPHSQRVVYLENLPWFLRPYMHTLAISGALTENMYYTPAIDRQKGTHLELLLDIPALATIEMTYEFEKAILRYTEYPPDANRGFDIPPAIIRVLPSNESIALGDDQGSYLRTTSLLLPLPTPDFSMPYNVIILTSTVLALGFGSIFNLLIRRFVLVEEVPKSPLAAKIQNAVGKLKQRVSALKGKSDSDRADSSASSRLKSDTNGQTNGELKKRK